VFTIIVGLQKYRLKLNEPRSAFSRLARFVVWNQNILVEKTNRQKPPMIMDSVVIRI